MVGALDWAGDPPARAAGVDPGAGGKVAGELGGGGVAAAGGGGVTPGTATGGGGTGAGGAGGTGAGGTGGGGGVGSVTVGVDTGSVGSVTVGRFTAPSPGPAATAARAPATASAAKQANRRNPFMRTLRQRFRARFGYGSPTGRSARNERMRDAAAATVTRDYYEILGVERDADGETIKRAFRARARALHPDVSDDPDAAEKFGELSEAYGVLSKPPSRLLYDRFGYRGRGNGWFVPHGARAAGAFVRRQKPPVGEVLVDELEAQRGVRRKVRWERRERCGACAGGGAAPGAFAVGCPACDGTGRRRVEASLSDGERLIQIEDCPDCRGRGRLVSERCPECDGAGERTVRRTSEVHVPAGSADGARVPLQDTVGDVVVRVLAAPRADRAVRVVAVLALFIAMVFLWLLVR